MKSFFIADILGEESRRDADTRTDECEGCKTHRSENDGRYIALDIVVWHCIVDNVAFFSNVIILSFCLYDTL